jgi:prepilin-type processing-associated H-X9-DG protein
MGAGLGLVLPLVAIVLVVGWVVHTAVEEAAEIGRRTRCAENLRRIAEAAQAYAQAHANAWPDVFSETSISWHDVGNTRTDQWDPVAAEVKAGAKKTPGVVSPKGPQGAAQKRHRVSFSPAADPAGPPSASPSAPPSVACFAEPPGVAGPAEQGPDGPGDNGLDVQSNTANLWTLIHWGLGPEAFICPATAHLVDRVDVAAIRTTYAAYLAERRKAEEAIAKAAAERAAAEKDAAEKAKTEVPRELTPADLFAPAVPKPKPEGPPEKGPAPPKKPDEFRPEKPPEDLAIGDIGIEETTAEKPTLPPRPAEDVPVATGAKRPAAPDIPLPDPPRIVRDFRGECFCSYSYQNVLGRFALTAACEAPGEVAVLADSNPMRRDFWSGPEEEAAKKKPRKAPGVEPSPPPDTRGTIKTRVRHGPTDRKLAEGTKFIQTEATANWNTEVTAVAHPWELNSPNHAFQGQNVLYLDGHVEWTVHPYCGPRMDNIWLRRRTDVARDPIFDQILNLREFNDPTSYDGRTSLDVAEKEDPSKGAPASAKKKKEKEKDELPRLQDSFLVP